MIRPVFANSATVRASERLILRGGGWHSVSLKVRYGFFIHPAVGPVLIDTGYGPSVVQGDQRSGALKLYAALLRPTLHAEQSPDALLKDHGLQPSDVAAVIVTHFHADHVSELAKFPSARFILDLDALDAIQRLSPSMRLHYGIFLELLPTDLRERATHIATRSRRRAAAGLPDGYDIFNDGSVLAVPLPGHAHGHFGLLFRCEPTPLLYAVDTQWLVSAISQDRAPGYPAKLIFADAAAATTSTEMARQFTRHGGQIVLCHDPASTPYDVAGAAI